MNALNQNLIGDHVECDRLKTNHILHFLISIFTGGLWVNVWAILTAINTSKRNKIHARYGISQETNIAAILIIIVLFFDAWVAFLFFVRF